MIACHWYRGPWAAVRHDPPHLPYFGPDKHIRARNAPRGPYYGQVGATGYDDDGTRIARSVQKFPSVRGGIHRTEKPVPLLRLLAAYACPPGGLIVNPFAGSCSTLMAARIAGMRSIGIEADEEACEKAVKLRLAQGDLFGGEVA